MEGCCIVPQAGVDTFGSAVFQTVVKVTTAEACQVICSNNARCRVALFNEKSSTCELMKVLKQPESSLDMTLVLPECDSGCFSNGQKLNGDGIPLGPAATAMIYQTLCHSEHGCNGFTWLVSTKACTSYSAGTDLVPDADAVSSGPRECCTPNKTGFD